MAIPCVRSFIRFCLSAVLAAGVSPTRAEDTGEPALGEAKVFEWWDDGIIDGDEAREILDLLEVGNVQEACMLAEVYALESCDSGVAEPGPPKARKRSRRQAKENRPRLVPHGYAEWSGRTDSLGHLESRRTEIRIDFYRYSLKLGSQSLLSYRNEGAEAHFGQVSTRELHSQIPLDTLWGTALLYPLGMFRLGALLDTATTSRVSGAIVPNRDTELHFAYWNNRRSDEHSFYTHFKSSWGSVAVWWAQDFPLLKMQLRHREKAEYATIQWKADAYLHGDSLPRESHLSSTIVKNRFWGSQTFAVTAADSWSSKFSLNARTMVPLESDTSKTRFKVYGETGPSFLRGGASATCLRAEERCRQNDLALKAVSTWGKLGRHSETAKDEGEQVVFTGRVRARHTRGQGFGPPLYEAGAAYAVDASNRASVAATIPKGSPARELQIRTTADVAVSYLHLSLAVTFRRTAETPLHPLHALLKARLFF